MVTVGSIEYALMVREQMFTMYDKRLFIILYGDLINSSFKKRLDKNVNVEDLFKELVEELKAKGSIKA
jgi:hypothetical protein